MEKFRTMEDLPDDCVLQILSYVSFHEVSRLRMVCKQMDRLCGGALNAGFRRFRGLHESSMKQIKESLPKRESERSKHRLNLRHTMLQSIDTRLSLLAMTFSRHIAEGTACFIPGKVLDELFRILAIIRDQDKQIPFHISGSVGFLQELRDLSSMAIEHFDDHVAPTLTPEREQNFCAKGVLRSRCVLVTSCEENEPSNQTLSHVTRKVKSQEMSIELLRSRLKRHKERANELRDVVRAQDERITEMCNQLRTIQRFLDMPVDSDSNSGAQKRKLPNRAVRDAKRTRSDHS